MVCNPNDININPDTAGPPPITPGFGLPYAPPSVPFPDLSLLSGVPEDLLDLLNKLFAIIPGGTLSPNLGDFSKTIVDGISSLLNQLAPYLALYKFFQALLNMVACIIDVVCALMNPFKLVSAVKKLFKQCLPEFLSLFPWLALLAMLIALLLLLIELIKYIIETITKYIEDIIHNIEALSNTIALKGTEDDIIAAVSKIAESLCLIENVMAALIGFEAIMAIVKSLGDVAGRSFCAKGSARHGSDGDCCSDEVCPEFIANNPDGFSGTLGQLVYHKEIDNDLATLGLPTNLVLPAIRNESWQFFDASTSSTYNFADIITEINGHMFWPEGKNFASDTNVNKVPYTVDLILKNINPTFFGHSDPYSGKTRDFIVKDVIVVSKPYLGLVQYDGSTSSTLGQNGVLELGGGTVYESDGTTYFFVSGVPATLNTFIHQATALGSPTFEDGYFAYDVDFTLKYNFDVLVGDNLITMGCRPDVAVESEILNLSIQNFDAISTIIPSLPDIAGTVNCITNAVGSVRQNVSPANAAVFQANVNTCLNNLLDQTITAYNTAVKAATSSYHSTIALDTDLQFIELPIVVSVTLQDSSGTVISAGVPSESQDYIASMIDGYVSLGSISKFSYDGYGAFTANLTSTVAGSGELSVSFDSAILSIVENRDNLSISSSISENIKTYQFVGSPVYSGGVPDPIVRRDPSDIAGGK